MSALDNRLPPPVLALAVAAAMATAGYVAGESPLFWRWRAVLAAPFFLAAAYYGPWAILAFRRAKTTIDPVRVDRASALVVSGPFSRTRNPMYVAMALLLASWAAWLGHAAPLLGPAIFVVYITRFQILPEERAMAARFGEPYRAYRGAVRRWL